MTTTTDANAPSGVGGFDAKKTSAQASHPKQYLVLRVAECALTFLRYDQNGGVDWGPLDSGSYTTTDGEAAYQTARANKGLKVRFCGLPSPRTLIDISCRMAEAAKR